MNLFTYRATIVRVIDGDTVVADVDLGFDVTIRRTFRLHGIDAPELRGVTASDGQRAKSHLTMLIESHSPLTIKTFKDKTEKYGRYLVNLIGMGGVDINMRMIEDGQASQHG